MELNKTKKSDLLKVDPRSISIDESFNVREEYGDIDELKLSIIKEGVKQPLRGRRDGNGFILTDGYRRLRAITQALKEGYEIPLVPIFPEIRGYTDKQRVADIIIYNSGKPLTAVEEAKVYERLMGFGMKQSDIAKKFGKTQSHVSNRLKLLQMSEFLRECLNKDLIKASLAIQIVKNYPEEDKQEKIVESAIEKMKLVGKKRISENHVTPEKKRSRYHKLFTESIEIMKGQSVTQDKIEKVQLIMESLDAKKPEDLVELLMAII